MAKRTLGPGTLTIGQTASAKEFAGSVSKIELSSSFSEDDPTPLLDGSNLDGETTETQTLKVTMFQDYEFAGLTTWTHEHANETLPFTFEPVRDAGTIRIRGELKVRRITIGGEVKKKNTADAEFPVTGLATIEEITTAPAPDPVG